VAWALALASLVHSVLGLYYLSQPLVILRGGVEGYVSLTGYRLLFLGEPVRDPFLDYVAYYVAPFLGSLVLLASFSLALAVFRTTRLWPGLAALAYGSALLSTSLLGGVYAVARLVAEEARLIHLSTVRIGGARFIYPGVTRVPGPCAWYLSSPLPVVLGAAVLVLSAYAFIQAVSREPYRVTCPLLHAYCWPVPHSHPAVLSDLSPGVRAETAPGEQPREPRPSGRRRC